MAACTRVTSTHVTAAHRSGLQININILLYNRSGGVRQNHSLSLSLSPAEEAEEESAGLEEKEAPEWLNKGECHSTRYGVTVSDLSVRCGEVCHSSL